MHQCSVLFCPLDPMVTSSCPRMIPPIIFWSLTLDLIASHELESNIYNYLLDFPTWKSKRPLKQCLKPKVLCINLFFLNSSVPWFCSYEPQTLLTPLTGHSIHQQILYSTFKTSRIQPLSQPPPALVRFKPLSHLTLIIPRALQLVYLLPP